MALAELKTAAEIIGTVQKTLDDLKKISDAINGDRSVICIVDNVTDMELRYEGSHCEHGGFQEPPPAVIPPRRSVAFSAQSAAGGLWVGVAGWVNYVSNYGERFYLHFDNPWAGSNGSDAALSAGDPLLFKATSITGSGERAQMRFIFLQNHISAGPIADKHAVLHGRDGVLGAAVTDWSMCPDGVGYFAHFQGGSIYYTQATGAFEVHGAIRDRWALLGFERGLLRYPITDETVTPDGTGRFNHFQGGSIYWTQKTGAHEVHGHIRNKWAALGWERSPLGYPTTDETVTPDGIGRFSHFQGGSIYWTQNTGAHEVHGHIRNKWAALGWEKSALGYPLSDELATPDGLGRYNRFQRGSIYWTEKTGAHEVRGAIALLWDQLGGADGKCGYPTTDEVSGEVPNSRMNRFQHGRILWTPEDGARFMEPGISLVFEHQPVHRLEL